MLGRPSLSSIIYDYLIKSSHLVAVNGRWKNQPIQSNFWLPSEFAAKRFHFFFVCVNLTTCQVMNYAGPKYQISSFCCTHKEENDETSLIIILHLSTSQKKNFPAANIQMFELHAPRHPQLFFSSKCHLKEYANFWPGFQSNCFIKNSRHR